MYTSLDKINALTKEKQQKTLAIYFDLAAHGLALTQADCKKIFGLDINIEELDPIDLMEQVESGEIEMPDERKEKIIHLTNIVDKLHHKFEANGERVPLLSRDRLKHAYLERHGEKKVIDAILTGDTQSIAEAAEVVMNFDFDYKC